MYTKMRNKTKTKSIIMRSFYHGASREHDGTRGGRARSVGGEKVCRQCGRILRLRMDGKDRGEEGWGGREKRRRR